MTSVFFVCISDVLMMERTCSAKLNIHIMLVDGVCRRESFGNGYLCMCGKHLCNEGNSLNLANTYVFYLFFLISANWLLWLRWRQTEFYNKFIYANSCRAHMSFYFYSSSACNRFFHVEFIYLSKSLIYTSFSLYLSWLFIRMFISSQFWSFLFNYFTLYSKVRCLKRKREYALVMFDCLHL